MADLNRPPAGWRSLGEEERHSPGSSSDPRCSRDETSPAVRAVLNRPRDVRPAIASARRQERAGERGGVQLARLEPLGLGGVAEQV